MGKFNLIAAVIGFGLFATSAAQASETINATGCLVRTDKAHQYSLTDDSGKTFELVADNGVNMRKHVGQKVMITGTETKRKKAEREGVEYLRVNQVKRVNASC